jgi:hypothetical protein
MILPGLRHVSQKLEWKGQTLGPFGFSGLKFEARNSGPGGHPIAGLV